MSSLAGKTAIVTGAATGIGRATAQLLAQRGARVVAAGLQPGELDATVRAIADAGGEAVAAHADVSDPKAIAEVAAAARDAFGGADVLVNNAGIYPLGNWHEMTAGQFDEVFHVNVRGYQLLAQAVRPQMLARGGGSIVNVASVTFWTGMGLLSTYIASKGAVIGLTRAIAREAGAENIRVNAVAPGAFATAASAIHADQDKLWREVLEAQSLKRRGEVEDVANVIAFFAGDESSFVTGQTLLVDGGWMFG
jgi:NAD(P)-dependent dehydrogenase (short-subunit alcohol dehydrogenase family)